MNNLDRVLEKALEVDVHAVFATFKYNDTTALVVVFDENKSRVGFFNDITSGEIDLNITELLDEYPDIMEIPLDSWKVGNESGGIFNLESGAIEDINDYLDSIDVGEF